MTFFDVITHLFLPHQSNNQRSGLLHPNAFLFYIVFFIFFGVGVRFVNKYAPNILGIATNISVADLLTFTNQKRQEAGFPPLSLNNELSAAAAGKAQDMFTKDYWAHYSPDGKSPWDFVMGAGYRYSFAGENLAKDFNDSVEVIAAWMVSPTHRDNILKPEYKDIGLAVVNGRLNGQETTLVVQMFGAVSSSAVTSQNIPPSPTPPTVTTAQVTPQPEASIFIAGVKKAPVIDLTSLNKGVSLLLLSLLTIVLTLDGFLILLKRQIRFSGHNIAHIIFFVGLGLAVWLTRSGVIL